MVGLKTVVVFAAVACGLATAAATNKLNAEKRGMPQVAETSVFLRADSRYVRSKTGFVGNPEIDYQSGTLRG